MVPLRHFFTGGTLNKVLYTLHPAPYTLHS